MFDERMTSVEGREAQDSAESPTPKTPSLKGETL